MDVTVKSLLSWYSVVFSICN